MEPIVEDNESKELSASDDVIKIKEANTEAAVTHINDKKNIDLGVDENYVIEHNTPEGSMYQIVDDARSNRKLIREEFDRRREEVRNSTSNITPDVQALKQANTEAAMTHINDKKNIDLGVDEDYVIEHNSPEGSMYQIVDDARSNRKLIREEFERRREEVRNSTSNITPDVQALKQANTEAAMTHINDKKNIDLGVDEDYVIEHNTPEGSMYQIVDDARSNRKLIREEFDRRREEVRNSTSNITPDVQALKQANTEAAMTHINDKKNIDLGVDEDYVIEHNTPEGSMYQIVDDARSNRKLIREEFDRRRENIDELTNIDITKLGQTNIEATNAVNDKLFENTRQSDGDIKFSVNYDSVVDNIEPLVDSITGTKLFESNKYQSCNSTSKFPESLNDANNYLLSASGDLLDKISNDVTNVAKVLSIYSENDNDLARKANSLYGDAWNKSSESYDFSNSLSFNLHPSYLNSFEAKIGAGKVGKIDMSDIDSMLSGGGSLTGPLANALKNEMDEGYRLGDNSYNFVTNTDFKGDVANGIFNRFNKYEQLNNARVAAAGTLKDAETKALQNIQNYYDETAKMISGSQINMGGALDDGQIPVCEATIVQLQQEIASLRAEYAACEAVPPTRGNGIFDEQGREGWEPNEPEYTIARNRMKEIKIIIPQKQQEIRYNRVYIDRLNGLAGVVNQSNGMVQSALNDINASYVSGLNDPIISMVNL